MPQPIPYQGSKRNIAGVILQYIPRKIDKVIEPFAGSAAISVAVAYRRMAQTFHLNDLNRPLACLLQAMIQQPSQIADEYQKLWTAQLGREREYYDDVRRQFNATHRPEFLLYLLARCVKASVRYNAQGELNQAPDNRRKGRNPVSMRHEILGFSELLRDRTEVTSVDFGETVSFINPSTDFVYLDPPYQGTSGTRDARYSSGVALSHLVSYLEELNEREAMFALSYDGIKGERTYGQDLPQHLHLHRLLLKAGRSTQSTLLGKSDITIESLYLSKALVARLCIESPKFNANGLRQTANPSSSLQLSLSFNNV
jgi:DNA adenine methylase